MPGPLSSLDSRDILGLLDDEELSALKERMSFDCNADVHVLADFSPARLLSEIAVLRLPFIRMMRDFSSLLGRIEASVRGNIRFVILPNVSTDLLLDFGPQIRRAIASSLNERLALNHEESISNASALLRRQIRSVCENFRPMPLERRDQIGQLLDQRAQMTPDPLAAWRDRWLADKVFTRTVREYHPADRSALHALADGLSQLEAFVKRLTVDKPYVLSLVMNLSQELGHLSGVVRQKLSLGPVSSGYPLPRRSLQDRDLIIAQQAVNRLREAVSAACDYAETLGDLYDFFNLQAWKERWRIYELWVMARIAAVLIELGATIADTRRIVDGLWRLKFTKDSEPVLGFELEGETVDLYYQFYQGRSDTGDMPDLAIRIRGGSFIAVVDPKHGYSYSRRDLNDVCLRYGDAFRPFLSCVCNYFPVRSTEEISQSPRALVLYGLEPGNQAIIDAFEVELSKAIEAAYSAIGRELFRPVGVVVLFDGSGSAEKVCGDLMAQFQKELAALPRKPRSESLALIFGSSIVRQGTLGELEGGSLLEGLVRGGTDFCSAVRSALVRLENLALPSQLWIFTDGEGLDDPLDLVDELQCIGSRLLLVEVGRSALLQLAEKVGSRYIQL